MALERIGPLHHVALRVADVERALAFYAGLLGLAERNRFHAGDGSLRSAWLDLAPGVLMLERRLRGAGAEEGSGHLLAVAVSDLPAWEARLAAAGVRVEDRTAHTLFVRDPDGHRVGLSDLVFPEPAAAGAAAPSEGRPAAEPASGPREPNAAGLLERYGRLASFALENERLLSTERAAREQAQALQAATQALSATLSLREVLAAILRELENVVPFDTASVQELRGDRMVIVGGRGIDLDHFLGLGFDAVRGGVPNREVLARGAPVIVADILGPHGYPDFPLPEHAASGVRSWLGVPLLFGSRCVGMITLDKREPSFYGARHAQAALAFAAQAAIAIENARLYEQSQSELAERRRAEEELRQANQRLAGQLSEIEELQARLREQAIRDPLTGLFNRRYLTETLARELARSAREGRPLSLVLLDVDHFKALNDRHGHEAGDLMLRSLGGFLGESSRQGDVACRYGGEEFVVVLPGAASDAARARAEVWRAGAERLRIAYAGSELSTTLSLGVACVPQDARTGDELLRRADAALYEAKRLGRNRVVAAESVRSAP